MTDKLCLVCQYEAETSLPDFSNPEKDLFHDVQTAVYEGVSLIFESKIFVCERHKGYITDEFPETLKRL